MADKQVFLNCPICKCGIDVADNGWFQICCPNCKVDIARVDWVDRDVLESKWLAKVEAAQQSVEPTLPGGRVFPRETIWNGRGVRPD